MNNDMYDKNNVFAKIIRGELQAKKVYEDDDVLAFYDIAPLAPIHVLVIPKGEYQDYSEFITNADAGVISNYFRKINDIITLLELDIDGFRLCTNSGKKSGQSVFHFHTHILGGAEFSGLGTK